VLRPSSIIAAAAAAIAIDPEPEHPRDQTVERTDDPHRDRRFVRT
jgi:hypothetical protein